MSEEEYVSVITDREELYDKCENMEQLYDKYYLPLLDIHFRKTYKLQQENKQLKEEKEEAIKSISHYVYERDVLKQQLKDKDEKISKAIEYIKDNTRYYDKEYSGIYGELCDCAGLGDTRLHVVVGDDELLKILEDKEVE